MQSAELNLVRPKQKKMTPKQLGELGEILFTAEAALRGFAVSIPCGETQHYDRIVDNGNLCLRVQVKTTSGTTRPGTYVVDCTHRASQARSNGKKKVAYTKEEIDFLVICVLPENAWYIVPVEALQGQLCHMVRVAGSAAPARMEEYRDAWHLLWIGGKPEKMDTGIGHLMAGSDAAEGAAGEGYEGIVREFSCTAAGSETTQFPVWTNGKLPTPEAVSRILGLQLGESGYVPVCPEQMGFA